MSCRELAVKVVETGDRLLVAGCRCWCWCCELAVHVVETGCWCWCRVPGAGWAGAVNWRCMWWRQIAGAGCRVPVPVLVVVAVHAVETGCWCWCWCCELAVHVVETGEQLQQIQKYQKLRPAKKIQNKHKKYGPQKTFCRNGLRNHILQMFRSAYASTRVLADIAARLLLLFCSQKRENAS